MFFYIHLSPLIFTVLFFLCSVLNAKDKTIKIEKYGVEFQVPDSSFLNFDSSKGRYCWHNDRLISSNEGYTFQVCFQPIDLISRFFPKTPVFDVFGKFRFSYFQLSEENLVAYYFSNDCWYQFEVQNIVNQKILTRDREYSIGRDSTILRILNSVHFKKSNDVKLTGTNFQIPCYSKSILRIDSLEIYLPLPAFFEHNPETINGDETIFIWNDIHPQFSQTINAQPNLSIRVFLKKTNALENYFSDFNSFSHNVFNSTGKQIAQCFEPSLEFNAERNLAQNSQYFLKCYSYNSTLQSTVQIECFANLNVYPQMQKAFEDFAQKVNIVKR